MSRETFRRELARGRARRHREREIEALVAPGARPLAWRSPRYLVLIHRDTYADRRGLWRLTYFAADTLEPYGHSCTSATEADPFRRLVTEAIQDFGVEPRAAFDPREEETMALSEKVAHVSSGEWACHAGPKNDQAIAAVPNGFALLDCTWHDYYRSFTIRVQVAAGAIPAALAEGAAA